MTAETPLLRRIKERIRRDGPLTVGQFMDLALNDGEHGYYRCRAAIGAEGDFITAPEISQVFGEIIGLWSAVTWQSMGAPQHVRLVEIGPGRGTLMADAVRASRKVPAFHAALDVHLVESNRVLTETQKTNLRDCGVPMTWHESFEGLLETGAEWAHIVIANEFLDTCPARQFVRKSEDWGERGIGLTPEGGLEFVTHVNSSTVPKADLGGAPAHAKPGDIFETQDFAFLGLLARLCERAPMAGLFFDYGHIESAVGDTFQALRHHRPEHPLASPGDADLTVHVDFEAFAAAARRAGFTPDGPLPQGEFLGRLGIIERASRLMAANPAKASDIELQVGRILSPSGMGSRFKAIGIRAGLPSPLPGF